MSRPNILRDGKTNERCLFGLDHCWSAIGDAMACGRCGRLSGPTARTLHVDQNTVKVNIHEFGWLVYLSEAVAS